jgi:hypothetical protein
MKILAIQFRYLGDAALLTPALRSPQEASLGYRAAPFGRRIGTADHRPVRSTFQPHLGAAGKAAPSHPGSGMLVQSP